MKICGIIPARFASTRLPGKPLKNIFGKSMIQRVYLQCLKTNLSDIFVATDHPEIHNHVLAFGGKSIMTSADHQSGTDRCLEAAEQIKHNLTAVVNIQGDEPFIDPNTVNQVVSLLENSEVNICTLAHEFSENEDRTNPNRVKVSITENGIAGSFSRISDPKLQEFQHVGIYGYRYNTLKEICKLEPSPLEIKEKLEQLRWFENGYSIHVGLTSKPNLSVDTPQDLANAIALAKKTEQV